MRVSPATIPPPFSRESQRSCIPQGRKDREHVPAGSSGPRCPGECPEEDSPTLEYMTDRWGVACRRKQTCRTGRGSSAKAVEVHSAGSVIPSQTELSSTPLRGASRQAGEALLLPSGMRELGEGVAAIVHLAALM